MLTPCETKLVQIHKVIQNPDPKTSTTVFHRGWGIQQALLQAQLLLGVAVCSHPPVRCHLERPKKNAMINFINFINSSFHHQKKVIKLG